MRHKLLSYQSVDEFVAEFQLIIASLLEASLDHSSVHRTIVRMKDQVVLSFAATCLNDANQGPDISKFSGLEPNFCQPNALCSD